MMLLAATPGTASLAAAMTLGTLGLFWLLPKPGKRSIALGTFAALAGLIVLAVWVADRFGPVSNQWVERTLFWFFSGAAVLFSAVFVTQRNPARGAIALAFVIVSVCGLFLLLAAPFLMAATIIIYAGAIIVTFLFVLMLSHALGPSDENDRSREPLLGSLAGFSFLGLVLFTMQAGNSDSLPARPMKPGERYSLLEAADKLTAAGEIADRDKMLLAINDIRGKLAYAVGGADAPRGAGNIPDRLAVSADSNAIRVRQQAEDLRHNAQRTLTGAENKLLKATVTEADLAAVKVELAHLAVDVRTLAAHGDLPARNVANLGYLLYSDYLLAVELAGAVLLVATLGAVQIAGRRETAA